MCDPVDASLALIPSSAQLKDFACISPCGRAAVLAHCQLGNVRCSRLQVLLALISSLAHSKEQVGEDVSTSRPCPQRPAKPSRRFAQQMLSLYLYQSGQVAAMAPTRLTGQLLCHQVLCDVLGNYCSNSYPTHFIKATVCWLRDQNYCSNSSGL